MTADQIKAKIARLQVQVQDIKDSTPVLVTQPTQTNVIQTQQTVSVQPKR